MEAKCFELRDGEDILPVVAVRMTAADDAQQAMLDKMGWPKEERSPRVGFIVSPQSTDSVPGAALQVQLMLLSSYKFIEDNWDELSDCTTLDTAQMKLPDDHRAH